jgi:RimJ/RimL family protein N-acetyltransferase
MPIRIAWTTDLGHLVAVDSDAANVAKHAEALARAYNDPKNAPLMGHTESISPVEVIASYADRMADGSRAFLLFRDDHLVGDADLRNFRDGAAEFAFMIGDPAAQGKGMGTRFAIMIHAFGFLRADLTRIFASIVPHNTASRRVFEKLGYAVDPSPAARAFADDPDDVVMSVDREAFSRLCGSELGAVGIHLA